MYTHLRLLALLRPLLVFIGITKSGEETYIGQSQLYSRLSSCFHKLLVGIYMSINGGHTSIPSGRMAARKPCSLKWVKNGTTIWLMINLFLQACYPSEFGLSSLVIALFGLLTLVIVLFGMLTLVIVALLLVYICCMCNLRVPSRS